MEWGIGIMCNLSEAIKEEGKEEINILNNWLFDNGRDSDVRKASNDPSYQKLLLKEMREAIAASV